MDKQKIDVVWNNAVSKVGGLRNTLKNFNNIANEFIAQAKEAGYTKEEVKEEIMGNYRATVGFMEAY